MCTPTRSSIRVVGESLKKLILLGALACAAPALAERPAYAPLLPVAKVDPATIAMPELAFTPTPEIERNYAKYFYFHRDNTDFETALADLRECDQMARKMSNASAQINVPYPYAGTMAGAGGGLLAAIIIDATKGAADRRSMRRLSMGNCMTFKDYKTYGLSKDLWTKFNWEEGNSEPEDAERIEKLRLQAKVASGPRPAVGGLN